MPTGYTENLYDGTDVSFEGFVWRCARGMAVLSMMRDQSLDAVVPEEFVPSTWYEQRLAAITMELARIERMTDEECAAEQEATRIESAAYEEENRRIIQRHKAMEERIHAWDSPPELAGLKRHMLEQLERSCPGEPSSASEPIVPAHEYRALKKEAQQIEHVHAQEMYALELRQITECNAWVRLLRKNVPQPGVPEREQFQTITKTVYVVIGHCYEEHWLVAAYADRALADQYAERANERVTKNKEAWALLEAEFPGNRGSKEFERRSALIDWNPFDPKCMILDVSYDVAEVSLLTALPVPD